MATYRTPNDETMCLMPNAALYSFMEGRKFCSLDKEHVVPHRAHEGHDLDAPVIWYGPWSDETPWRDVDGVMQPGPVR